MSSKLLETIKKLPDQPGVYFFKDKEGQVLYIGKATSLRDRVKSYFSKDLVSTRGMLLVKMVESAATIEHVVTDSVLEALILEAVLIKKHQPFHNTREKDDKTHNFVVFTNESFPRILVLRGREVEKDYIDPTTYKAIYGPFPNGSALRIAMKIIRRIFPYRDNKCVPAEDQLKSALHKTPRPCFNRHIGLCPGVCTGEVDKKEYAKIVKHLMMFFEGRKKVLLAELEREMKKYAKLQEFEKANGVKRTVFALQHIQDVALIGRDGRRRDVRGDEVDGGGSASTATERIEAYDISHLSGMSTVGVMTVVEQGEATPAEYRMFKIRQQGNDDLRSLGEVLTRRFAHPEWPWPILVVVDGGKTHMDHAAALLKKLNITIPVVSVVKDERHQPRDVLSQDGNVQQESLIATHRRDILLANSEAHRFAIKYHRNLRNRVQL